MGASDWLQGSAMPTRASLTLHQPCTSPLVLPFPPPAAVHKQTHKYIMHAACRHAPIPELTQQLGREGGGVVSEAAAGEDYVLGAGAGVEGVA